MKFRIQLERLMTEIQRHGALMDDIADAAVRMEVEVTYPRLFAELVARHMFLAFNVGKVRISSNIKTEEDNLEDLFRDKVLTNALVEAGFFPFGRPVTGNYDRVCFDMRGVNQPLDASVVLMRHEAILSHNKIPKPAKLADGIIQLFTDEGPNPVTGPHRITIPHRK